MVFSFCKEESKMTEKLPLGSAKFDTNSQMHTGNISLYTENLPALTYTVDDAVNTAGYGKFQLRLMLLSGMSWCADAFEIIILSIIGDFISCEWKIEMWQNAILTSIVFLGISIGAPVFGSLADVYGRKKSLAGSMFLIFVFGAASAASPSFIWMMVFRMLMGFALGGVAQSLTLYCEYVPAEKRGRAGFYLCYFWSAGTVSVILLAWVIMIYTDSWRILLVTASLPALICLIFFKWNPESARFYLVSNKYKQAQKILQEMAKINGTKLPPGKLVEMNTCTKRGRLQDLLTKEYRTSILLFWYIWFAVAFCYYGIALLSPIIIKNGTLWKIETNGTANFMSDLTHNVPCVHLTNANYITLLWTSAAEFPGLVAFTFLIDRCNRKNLMATSCVLSCIITFLLLLNNTILVMILLFGVRALVVAIFQLAYIMTAETFPTTLRAIAMGSGSAFCRIGGLIVPYIAQVLIQTNPIIAISVLGIIVFVAGIAATFLPIETRGATMTESHDAI